jgi:hypothetical protein
MNAAEISPKSEILARPRSSSSAVFWAITVAGALWAAKIAWAEPRMAAYVAALFWSLLACAREVRRLLHRLATLKGAIANQADFADAASPDRVLTGARFWAHGLIASGTLLAMVVTVSMVLSIARTTSSEVAGHVWLSVFGARMWLVSTSFVSQLSSTTLAVCALAVMAGAGVVVFGRHKIIDRGSIGLLVWVAGSGLSLWISHRYFAGAGYYWLALFHTTSVVTLLLAIPSSRLSHMFVRPIMLHQMRLILRRSSVAGAIEGAPIEAATAVTITPKDRRIRFAQAQQKQRGNRWLTRR